VLCVLELGFGLLSHLITVRIEASNLTAELLRVFEFRIVDLGY